MAVSICLKLGDKNWIKGESVTSKHENEIDVLSWSFGLTQSASAHIATGAGTGSADVRDLTITKYVDAATPNLLQGCFYGNDYTPAVLTVLKSGGKEAIEMIKMTMDGTVFISSVQTGDPLPNDRYSETVSLNFAHAKIEYTGQKADGSKGASVSGEMQIAKKH
jgi:type VI secretion system secreted protein Hcp